MIIGGQGRGVNARLITAAATAALLLAGCATAPEQTLANLSSEEAQAVDQTCRDTFGAQPGDTYFEACRTSLAGAVHRRDEARRVAQTRVDCTKSGAKEGSSALALCVLGAKAVPTAGPQRLMSLTVASRDEVHRRIERSCATLGFDPSSVAFASCVADLEASVAEAESPTIG